VVGAEGDAGDDDLLAAARVVADERHHLVDDPVLVQPVQLRAFLERHVVPVPAARVEAVDGVDLHPPGLDQVGDRVDHPALLVLPGRPLLGGKREQRTAPVAVGDHTAVGADRRGPERDVAALHVLWSSLSKCGWKESRQAIQLCPSRNSCRRAS
jgi:hypothetical protein